MPPPVRAFPALQVRSRRTVDRLLTAAQALFAERGISEISVVDICRRAGVGVGTFYGRFVDKEALLRAFYDRYFARSAARFDHSFPRSWAGRPAAEIVAALVRQRVAHYRRNRSLLRALVLYAQTRPDAVFRSEAAPFGTLVYERLRELLFTGDGGVRVVDPDRAVRSMLVMIEATTKDVILFSENRSPRLQLSDRELTRELTGLALARLGLPSRDRRRAHTSVRALRQRADRRASRAHLGSDE
ncbi:MAG TPA: helix-turn-helix domain-containing protein [Gemmatimonadales bacterium]|nr:helix-turn-helix domain-containing protein [Gemmatimonadales bacterium]